MQARMFLALPLLLSFFLAGCGGKSLLKSDCHSCTVDDQRWKDFEFASLNGGWQGSVETLRNDRDGKKRVKEEKSVSFRFLSGADFLKAQGVAACSALPTESVVMNGVLWDTGAGQKEFEAFVPVDDGKVAYGRLSFNQINGRKVCQFRRLGRVMGQNRLALPATTFSEYAVFPGRQVASTGAELELSVEFLRFAPATAAKLAFAADGRKPASAQEQERPPLMIRVFRISTVKAGERGQWRGTEEQLFRLWRM
jgi:hypothetical protein